MKTGKGLTYTQGSLEDGVKSNIDMMGHSDPAVRAAARLNRDLINAIDAFLTAQGEARNTTLDTMHAVMHGVTTVCGTILVNIPPHKRPMAFEMMRGQLLQIFDAMGQLTTVTERDDGWRTD